MMTTQQSTVSPADFFQPKKYQFVYMPGTSAHLKELIKNDNPKRHRVGDQVCIETEDGEVIDCIVKFAKYLGCVLIVERTSYVLNIIDHQFIFDRK